MEWAKDTADSLYESSKDTVSEYYQHPTEKVSERIENTKDTASEVYNHPTDTVYSGMQTASDTAKETAESVASSVPSKSTTASIIDSQPFKSFKPDASTVWKAYLIYVIVGAGCVLSWHAFITAVDYFQLLYPNYHILRWITLAYLVPWLTVYLLFNLYGRQFTSFMRINIALCVTVVPLLLIPILDGVFIKGDYGTAATFWITLAAVALAGSAEAVGHGSLLSVASELVERYMQAYMTGTAAAGILLLVVRAITKACLNSTPGGLRVSGIIYFSLAAFFQLLILALFNYIHNMPSMGYYVSLGLGSFETVRLILQDEDTVTKEVAAGAAIAAIAGGRPCPTQALFFRPAFERVQLLMIAVGVVSFVTLSIYPGFLLEDLHYFGSWYPILLIAVYNCFDFLGKAATSRFLPRKESGLFGVSWARLIFIVLFVVLLLWPARIQLLTIIVTALLGASNGYLLASLMILVPKSVPSQDAEAAGTIMVYSLLGGCIIGATSSWIWLLF